MSILIRDGRGGGHLQGVDADNNALVTMPLDGTQAGFATLQAESDSGAVIGSRSLVALEASEDFRLRVGVDAPLFYHEFSGTVITQDRIQQNLSTMTASQASGFLTLNAASATASGNAANIRTYRAFPCYGQYPLYATMVVREANETSTNTISEWGLMYVSGTSAPTDGVFFRRVAGGALQAVNSYGGTETTSVITTTNVPAGDGSGVYSATERNRYLVVLYQDLALYWINDTLVATINCLSTQPSPTQSGSLPVAARVYNTGVASAGRQIQVGGICVEQGDLSANMPWSHIICGSGGGAYQVQPGTASGMTTNWANSAAPSSFTFSNTAAGYTTLGGQWQLAAIAAAETDAPVFSFTVPAGTSTLPGKTLFVTGVRIGETYVTGAAVVTPTIFQWGLAVGSTAVSLATTDGAATVAPRRLPLGSQAFLASAAIGTIQPGFFVPFDAPAVCPPGTQCQIIVKQPGGAATASLVWRGTVLIQGYFM